MKEHAADILPILSWIIVMVGGALIALVGVVYRMLEKRVDKLPDQVAGQVSKVHDELIEQMKLMNDTQKRLEHDMRESLTQLDRRVVRLEVRCDMQHGKTGGGNG